MDRLTGVSRLMAQIIYGSGLRLEECLKLRIKVLDFDRERVTVRFGKGGRTERRSLIYTHVAIKNLLGTKSPLDQFEGLNVR